MFAPQVWIEAVDVTEIAADLWQIDFADGLSITVTALEWVAFLRDPPKILV